MRFVQALGRDYDRGFLGDGSLMLLGGTFSAWEQTERDRQKSQEWVAYMIRARKA